MYSKDVISWADYQACVCELRNETFKHITPKPYNNCRSKHGSIHLHFCMYGFPVSILGCDGILNSSNTCWLSNKLGTSRHDRGD